MTLDKLYNEELTVYEKSGVRENPDKLLAMLMLQHMDKYIGNIYYDAFGFYKEHRYDVNRNVAKVIRDFKFSKHDILEFISYKYDINDLEDFDIKKRMEYGLYTKYQYEKILYAFYEGIECVVWGIENRNWATPEEIYFEFFRNELTNDLGVKKLKLDMTKGK